MGDGSLVGSHDGSKQSRAGSLLLGTAAGAASCLLHVRSLLACSLLPCWLAVC